MRSCFGLGAQKLVEIDLTIGTVYTSGATGAAGMWLGERGPDGEVRWRARLVRWWWGLCVNGMRWQNDQVIRQKC